MSEFRAYELELLAADRLSAGRLRLALDIALDVTQPTSLQSLVSEARALAAAQHQAFATLISPERPNSSTEASLRAGFFAAALLLRYAERAGNRPETDPSILDAIDALMRSSRHR
jgi:rhamnogalacturonyl hydrolase YesR